MKDERTLYERLLDAGYSENEIFHHETDLYIFATPETDKIISTWCKDKGFSRSWFVSAFRDNVTGKLMYDIAFAYDPAWNNR